MPDPKVNSSAVGIDRFCLITGGLELVVNGDLEPVVFALAGTEGLQPPEPNSLLRRNESVKLARGQHIESPVRHVERVNRVAVLTLEKAEVSVVKSLGPNDGHECWPRVGIGGCLGALV